MAKRISNLVIAKKFILVKHFCGFPKRTDLCILEETLPQIKEGEFLTEAVYLSVDPYMRAYQHRWKLGSVFNGLQVAKVTESKSQKFPIGKYLVGDYGWRTHKILDEKTFGKGNTIEWTVPSFGNLPISLAAGILGLTGNTAYFGFLEICKPKTKDVVVVSGAAGAVGSHVGQIAKIKGCKVIGITGDNTKGKYLIDELRFDHFINYKEPNLKENLIKYAPKVDCYFDNVGGEISSIVLSRMNHFGRVSVCGAISSYNSNFSDLPKATTIQGFIAIKQLTIEGFLVNKYINRWHEGISTNLKWITDGKLKYKETVTEGFENTFQAFTDMLEGKNIGKAIVKV
ncbi:hypothetical protein RN001_001913 [Aquatica leii]|uniref:Prostaglandin reductase 1 n=1 Tax=Aquatica leii TaxID=1421715 RepID=A0AAN7PGH6_9COLE|nr:hypothetical protein RN001_001913 [Aquatica leii]